MNAQRETVAAEGKQVAIRSEDLPSDLYRACVALHTHGVHKNLPQNPDAAAQIGNMLRTADEKSVLK
jgi:hypothetical protein